MVNRFLGGTPCLFFALPQSPMAQHWAVIAGNTLAALVGISVIHLVGKANGRQSIDFGGGVHAALLAHPAAALTLIVVLARIMHYQYVFFQVMIDSMLLVLAGAIYSNLTGKRNPNRPYKV